MDNKEFGIRRIQKMINEAGLPLLRYKWDNFVTAIFPLEEEKLSVKTSVKIIEIISDSPNITIPELSEIIGVTERSVERNLQKLQKEGKIKRIGPDKGGYWQVSGNSG
jgi:ATP-dependent DNA helicase RecG